MEIDRTLGSEKIRFYPGISYRHLMVWADGSVDIECVPPHDILGKEIMDYLPVGTGEQVIREIMQESVGILDRHPVNLEQDKRREKSRKQRLALGAGQKAEDAEVL